MSGTARVRYDAALVEAAVLLAERRLAPIQRASFRAQRDRIYECGEEDDEREARFEELHGRFFLELGLDRPLHAALAERADALARVEGCRALRAIARRDEGADVCDDLSPAAGARTALPLLVLRLRPESLLDAERLLRFLRRELLHVADMLDPAFGYERELAIEDGDPARTNLLRERYRAVWEATVEGRLAARHGLEPQTREARRSAFARTFPGLGDGAEPAFARWFDEPSPTHGAILEFAGAAAPGAA